MPKSEAVFKTIAVVSAGGIAGLISAVAAVSFATLVFSGHLAPFAAGGIGIALFSAGAVGVLVALFSSCPGTVAVLHGSTSAVLALMSAKIGSAMAGRHPDEAVLASVLAAIALTTILTALAFWLLGVFRLGRVIRFIPYPVIGGFMAGSGWLLVLGAFRVMAGGHVALNDPGALLRPASAALLLPGTFLAVGLMAIERRIGHFLVLPGVLLAGMAGFHLLHLAPGGPAFGRILDQCLLGPFAAGGLWRPPDSGLLARVEWGTLAGSLPDLASILLISALSLLLHASSTELAVRRDVDFDSELRAAGAANLASGLTGGMIGYGSLPYTIIGHTMGVASRWVGVVAGGVCFAMLALGPRFICFFPRPVIGGLLLYLGLKLLAQWAFASRRSLPLADFVIIWLILLIIATLGFLEGVAAGVLAGIVLFVVKYSRISVVKNALTGEKYRSNVDRPQDQRYVLLQKGEEVLILVLQGFVFFGTANSLLERLREELERRERLAFVLFDFRRVSGMDSSGSWC